MRKTAQVGSNLIEALIGVMFVSLAIVVILTLQNKMGVDGGNSAQRKDAIILAQDKLDSLRNYTVISTTPGQFAYDDIVSGSDTPTVKNTVFTRRWTVEDYLDPDYKTVDVVMSWMDKNEGIESVRITTIIGKIDPSKLANIY